MLQAAPATLAEMSARRFGTTGTWRQQLDKFSRLPVATSLTGPHADPVARHRQRNVKTSSGMLGDTISAGADAQDRDIEGAAPDCRGFTGRLATPAPASPHPAAQPDPLSPTTRLPLS
jgi:hypothetical protein